MRTILSAVNLLICVLELVSCTWYDGYEGSEYYPTRHVYYTAPYRYSKVYRPRYHQYPVYVKHSYPAYAIPKVSHVPYPHTVEIDAHEVPQSYEPPSPAPPHQMQPSRKVEVTQKKDPEPPRKEPEEMPQPQGYGEQQQPEEEQQGYGGQEEMNEEPSYEEQQRASGW